MQTDGTDTGEGVGNGMAEPRNDAAGAPLRQVGIQYYITWEISFTTEPPTCRPCTGQDVPASTSIRGSCFGLSFGAGGGPGSPPRNFKKLRETHP